MPNKLIVILGPTASGKSDLAVKLARRFYPVKSAKGGAASKTRQFDWVNGEIVSADSRQVYKGLDVGSGKITKKEMQGIPHHLLDVASPRQKFTIAQYQKLAIRTIQQIQRRGRIPFLVGGTGFYIQSIVDGTIFPEVPPNRALRARLAKKSVAELFGMLKKLDPARAAAIDSKNPHRLIRAIEIVKTTGKPVSLTNSKTQVFKGVLIIGISKSSQELKQLIAKRLQKRIKKIITEVWLLHNPPTGGGLSWKRLEELGLEYRYMAQYLQKKISLQQVMQKIQIESEHFAKRQMTWFKRDPRIHWIHSSTPLEVKKQAQRLIKKFL